MKAQVGVKKAHRSTFLSRASDYVVLAKVRISLLVTMVTIAGFVVGSEGPVDGVLLLHTLGSVLLIAAGTAALNQVMERDLDGRMRRTATRPLPAGRLRPEDAWFLGVGFLALGILYAGLAVGWLVSVIGAATSGIYLLLYTPLKRRSSHHTTVGAVAGALPPVGGWAAARGEIGGEAWALFVILFLWQFPHFLAVSWIHRADYARGGCRTLSTIDAGGVRTSRQAALFTFALLPFSQWPALTGLSGPAYSGAAVLLGAALLSLSLCFARSRTDRDARRLLRATLVYLPALLAVMVADRMCLL